MNRDKILLIVVVCVFSTAIEASLCENFCRFLGQYKRDITILVLGSDALGVGITLAEQFQNAAINVISTESIIVTSNNIAILSFNPTPKYLKLMRECEYFDVIVYAFSKFEEEIYLELRQMTDYLFLTIATHTKLSCHEEDVIIEKDSNNVNNINHFVIKTNSAKRLRKRSLVWPSDPQYLNEKEHIIYSTFESKKLYKRHTGKDIPFEVSNWLKGINLITFLFFNGTFPTKKQILRSFQALRKEAAFLLHSDLTPANLIVDGTHVWFIDSGNSSNMHPSLERRISFVELFINQCSILNRDQFKEFYWKSLEAFR